MSCCSERRIRHVIVASTGISLLGVASAFVDYGATHRIFTMSESGGTSAATRSLPVSTNPAVKTLSTKSENLFRAAAGKQDRADLVADEKPVRNAKPAKPEKSAKAEQPEFITAAFIEMPYGAVKKPTPAVLQDVNRGTKGDRLSLPQMTVAKFVPPEEQASVHASAAVFLVSPPLADAQTSETTASTAATSTAAADAHASEGSAVKGPIDDKKLSPADVRTSGKSYWDDLVKLASVKADDASDKKTTLFGGFTEKEEQARQLRCMATAVYFEARDEPLRGQIAVAQVIMTRVKSEYYPKTICEVIYQGAQHKNSCQFSFACDGKADVVHEKKEWATSLDIARQVISGKVYLTDIGDATHYHATYVHPDWIKLVKRVKQIGGHIFYRASFAPPLIANADYSKL